jgi:hypothetical protein
MRPALLLPLALAAGGCHISYEDPVQVQASVVTLSVAPDPLRLLVTCPPGNPNCFASLDATVTVSESAGLGGRIEFVGVALYNVATARTESYVQLNADWLRAHAGTDRVEAKGRLAVRPVVEGYPYPAGQPRPQLQINLLVKFVDDRGNTLEVTKAVPLQ